MTPHDTIHRRGRKPIPVELRRKRAVDIELCRRRLLANEAARDPLREIGCAIVAEALGDHAAGVGGVMTGERARELDGRLVSSPSTTKETKAKTNQGAKAPPIVIPAPGLLAADISRNIFPDRQRQFGADLIGGVL